MKLNMNLTMDELITFGYNKKTIKAMSKYLFKELGLASFIFFWAAYSGLDRTREIVAEGLGSILVGIGALWLVGAFFRMNLVIPLLTSLFCALGLVIFGFGLGEYGFFAGLTLLGIYSIILSIGIVYPFNVNLGFKMLITGVVFAVCFGFISSVILMVHEERQDNSKQTKVVSNIGHEIQPK